MFTKNWPYALGSVCISVLAYLLYIKKKYNYLKYLGFDGPEPKYLLGNLTEFASKSNSVENDETNPNTPVISHYSKTLRRWTKTYGKIYGYYEGHSPVLVLADPDLVTQVFVNQNKLVSHRRSFPMSKHENDPNADIFITNGLRWLRVRYGLEKVMLNSKNTARCLEYFDRSFFITFNRQPKFGRKQPQLDIYKHSKLLMVQAMFSIIFGGSLNTFVSKHAFMSDDYHHAGSDEDNLNYAGILAHRFGHAFEEYEAFSVLKFAALMFPEFELVWKSVEKFKRVFNANLFRLKYFADPMDWFYINFIEKQLKFYVSEHKMNEISTSVEHFESNFDKTTSIPKMQSTSQPFLPMLEKKFSYFNSFLYLAHNPIIKYNESMAPRKEMATAISSTAAFNNRRRREFPSSSSVRFKRNSLTTTIERTKSLSSGFSSNSGSSGRNSGAFAKTRHYSTENWLISNQGASNGLGGNDEVDFENWKLTVNEALSNTLLMFFAGYETTSSAIGFCCHVISSLTEQRDKLVDEIKEYWDEIKPYLERYDVGNSSSRTSSSENSLREEDDDVFETTGVDKEKDQESKEQKPTVNSEDKWHEIYESLEKLKYLDMFVKEVLRMFPIANTMVSRKCAVEKGLRIDDGNYYIPKGMNVVVDVLSIHYDPVLWGPVDPEIFYPERFLTERNPTAWLPFGIGSRKCLGVKLAMSQIKLFIVRLLQVYMIERPPQNSKLNPNPGLKKFAESIETKEVLFCSPTGGVFVSIEPK